MSSSPKHSPPRERIASEDPDTAATRKELRQTAISDKPDLSPVTATDPTSSSPKPDKSEVDEASDREKTPAREASDEPAIEQMASPKKKRQHDEVDDGGDPQDTAGPSKATGTAAPAGGEDNTPAAKSGGGEPERKRPRDIASDPKGDKADASSGSPKDDVKSSGVKGAADKPKVTSASAFKNSGMASYATQASPFLQAGSSQSSSPFASAAPASGGSVFKSAAAGLSSATASPFGSISGVSSPFGGVSASPFGGFTGPRLTSFAQPGASLTVSKKPAKPFGAPESDPDDDNDGDDNAEDGAGGENSGDGDADGDADGDNDDGAASTAAGDSKGPKLQRVTVDDGEEHEATLLQIRARLYYLDKASNVWKERGAGNLKINVPIECVDIDETTKAPFPGSFDASALADSKKNARLVMRQDSTHRVILNTTLIPSLIFKEISGLKANRIIFTAYEAEGAVSVQIKVSAASAKTFLNEVGKVQRELQEMA